MSASDGPRGGWVRFARAWDWNIPKYGGRATKHFAAGLEIRLPGDQLQSAKAAGAVVCIPNPRTGAAQDTGETS